MEISQIFLLYIITAFFCLIKSCTNLNEINFKKISNKSQESLENFLIIDHLSDNEKEMRIKWKNLIGKRTSLDLNENERFINSSLALTSLWQLTNGKIFAQLIFNGKNLIDCELIHDENGTATDFVDKFIEEFHYIHKEKLGTTRHQYHKSENIDKDLIGMRSNVRLIKLRNFQDIPEEIIGLMNLKKIRKQCNKLHKEIRRKIRTESSEFYEENEEHLNSERNLGGKRGKRQTDSWFIMPNTKWCGSGSNAAEYKELGPSRADQCCRKHDICNVQIPPLQTRFGLFNIRPFTISHCKCDRRFRTCLKMADTNDANMVGKLFFNIVQTKCFVLKKENACILNSWWGKCMKYKVKKQAYLRDNNKY